MVLSGSESAVSIRYGDYCAISGRLLSIFKLVDTKSTNNTTLLHFVEKTVSQHFPEIAKFVDELEKPADAYRGK